MRFIALFTLVFLVAGFFGTLIFLNIQPVELVLTPPINGIYYHIPQMPLGLLVVLSVLLGFLLGYVFNAIQKFK